MGKKVEKGYACAICGARPAFYQKQYQGYLCTKHATRAIRKWAKAALLIATAYILYLYIL